MTPFTLDLFDSEIANELFNGDWLPKMAITRSSGSIIQVETSHIRRYIFEYTYIPDEIPTEANLLPLPACSLYRVSRGCLSLLQHLQRYTSIENRSLALKILRYKATINSTIVTKVYRSFWHAIPLEYLSTEGERKIFISKLLQAKKLKDRSISSYLRLMANFCIRVPTSTRCRTRRKFAKIFLLPFLPFDTASLLLQMPPKTSTMNKCIEVWFHCYFYTPGNIVAWDRKHMQTLKFTLMKQQHLALIHEHRRQYPCQDIASSWDINQVIGQVSQIVKRKVLETEAEVRVLDTFITTETSYLEAANIIGIDQLTIMLKKKYLDRGERERIADRNKSCWSVCWGSLSRIFNCTTSSAMIHPDPNQNMRSIPAAREHSFHPPMIEIKTIP